jgi:hypothetical protein
MSMARILCTSTAAGDFGFFGRGGRNGELPEANAPAVKAQKRISMIQVDVIGFI